MHDGLLYVASYNGTAVVVFRPVAAAGVVTGEYVSTLSCPGLLKGPEHVLVLSAHTLLVTSHHTHDVVVMTLNATRGPAQCASWISRVAGAEVFGSGLESGVCVALPCCPRLYGRPLCGVCNACCLPAPIYHSFLCIFVCVLLCV